MVARVRFTINGWIMFMFTLSKEQGLSKFNMGMATLSNVGQLHYSYFENDLQPST